MTSKIRKRCGLKLTILNQTTNKEDPRKIRYTVHEDMSGTKLNSKIREIQTNQHFERKNKIQHAN